MAAEKRVRVVTRRLRCGGEGALLLGRWADRTEFAMYSNVMNANAMILSRNAIV